MNSRRPRIAGSWSNLPPELLDSIGKRLQSDVDVRRFRAVCRSWRSSTPPYKFPTINLPFPFDAKADPDPNHSGAYFTLTERIVYRIQMPDSKNPDFWLVKVEHAENGKLRIINPVTHHKISIPSVIRHRMPKVLNILDFDVTIVSKGYALRYVNPSKPDEKDDYYDYRHAKKVVFSANVENGEFAVYAIDRGCRLWRIKSGRNNWSLMGERIGLFYDVAIVNGQVHATDSSGGVWIFYRKFGWKSRTRKQTPTFKRRVVELYNQDLILVEEMGGKAHGPNARSFLVREPVVSIGIYSLSEGERRWVDAREMDGCIIVVGDDCSYSIRSSQELKAARVFFTDRYSFLRDGIQQATGYYTGFECDCRFICTCFDELEAMAADDLVASEDVRLKFEGFYGYSIGVVDCETDDTGTALMFPEYASIFWPPPSWLSRS